MKATTANAQIRPELVAEKLSRAFNFELPEFLEELEAQPRLAEILWTLQWSSDPDNYRGGLERFVRDMLAECDDLIHYPSPADFQAWKSRGMWSIIDECHAKHNKLPSPEEVREACLRHAAEHLPSYLRALCERPDLTTTAGGGAWFLPDIVEVALAFIDRRAKNLAKELAETEVTQLVFRWIAKARSTGRAVRIVGNSRCGKTEAVRLFCKMYPGSARLVETPASNTEGDLLREVARALGLHDSRARLFELRASVDDVLRRFRPVLIFDEAQFLFPTQFNRNSQPARLNWYRRQIVDRNIPSVLVETPQSSRVRNGFLKATGFAIEQLDERILKTVRLPDELSEEDLLAVARIHLPDSEFPGYVVNLAIGAGRNFVSDLEKIGTLARDYASEEGRESPNLDDIKAATQDVFSPGNRPAKAPARAAQPPAIPRTRDRGPSAPAPVAARRWEHSDIETEALI